MNYLAYYNDGKRNVNYKCTIVSKIEIFTPTLWQLWSKEYKEIKSIKATMFRAYISVLTKNKTKIYYAFDDNGNILHTSFIIPPNIKFSFLKENEMEIGPCYTNPNARGQGVYPYVLDYIVKNNKAVNYLMIIKEENLSSIRGVTKAGFVKSTKEVTRTKILNLYKYL